MAKSVDRKYSVFLAGYYDDFNASRAIADDENNPNLTGLIVHTASHFGNSLNGEARLNPRYKKAYKERVDGDETHNLGAHEFLTNDTMRKNSGKYEGKAQPSYPDGITQGNRYKFGADASLDSFQTLTNGYNTSGRYSVHLGNNDPSQGKSAAITIPDMVSSNLYKGGSAESDSFASATNIFQYANICSVHVGEVAPDANQLKTGYAGDPFSKAILEPIESLDSGKPMLAINTHIRENMTRRLVSYNANLGAASDKDIFGLRMAWRNWSGWDNGQSTGHSYTIKVGFRRDDYTDANGFSSAVPAATYTFTTSSRKQNAAISGSPLTAEATGLKTGYLDRNPWFKKSALTGSNSASLVMAGGAVDGGYNVLANFGQTPESTSFPSDNAIPSADQTRRWTLLQIWNDIEFKFDWTAGTYDVLHDGEVVASAQAIGINPDTGNKYKAPEVFGWDLSLDSGLVDGYQEAGTDTDYVQITTLLDRAYLWRDIADSSGIGGEQVTLSRASINYTSNGISQCQLDIHDDFDNLDIFKVFEEETNQLQELMLFRDNIHRCVWRGHIERYTSNQNRPGEKIIKLSARDYLASLDRTIPIWEVGQSEQIDETEPIGWRPYESANFIEKLHLGATSLERGTGTLGYERPNYNADTSTRMRLNSGHPIQMYNEEGGAPDTIYDYVGQTHIYGFQKPEATYANPSALTNPLRVYSDAHGYTQGETINIQGSTNYSGSFTVHDPSTNHFYIDKTYVPSGKILAIDNNDSYDDGRHKTGLKHYWTLQFDEIYKNPALLGGEFVSSSAGNTRHLIDWEKQYVTISDTRVFRGASQSGQRYNRISELPSDSSTTINGVTVTPRDLTRGNLDIPMRLTSSNRVKHTTANITPLQHDYPNTLWSGDIPDPTNWQQTTRSSNCGYHFALIDADIPNNPKTGRAQVPGGGYTVGSTPFDNLYRSWNGFGSALPGPPTSQNQNNDTFAGQMFDASWNAAHSTLSYTQQDWLNRLGWFRVNSNGDNVWQYWSATNILDNAHGGSEPAGNLITKLYFKTGENINIWDLYIGQRLVIRYGGNDAQGNPIQIPQGTTGNNWDGIVTLVFEITGFGNMPDPGQTWIDGTHYLEVSQLGNGTYNATYGDLANLYYNHNEITGLGLGTAGEVGWFLYDSPDLEYCNEQATAPLAAANNSIARPYRAVHSRWIQDMPKSKWFQMQFGRIKEKKISQGKNGSTYHPDVLLSSDIFPNAYTTGQTVSIANTRLALNDQTTGNPIGLVTTMATSGGVGEIVDADGTVDSFTFTGLAGFNAVDQTYASITGVQFLSKFHSAGSIVRFREIDNDYKHIWILWADMRNDGTANADSGLRKKKFGLMMPISNNYSVSMEFVDSEEPDGSPVKFADLKVGEDLDIWELDSTLEPVTQAPWSALPLGSNSDSNSIYHNWEDKAGSFVVIDTSKFWNVNTEANLGRTGRIGGGRTDLQDYFAVGHGFPIMMDNYWIEAMPSYKTIQHPYMPHPQQMDFIQDASEVKRNQPDNFSGINRLYLDDVTEWDDSGVGRIVAVEGAGQTKTTYTWYYAWSGRNTVDNYLNNVFVDIVGGLNGVPTKTAAERTIAANNIKAAQQNGSSSRAIFDLEDYDSVTAYNSYAPLSGMRFMMRISGKVENENSGTWFESEKFRFLNMLSLTKNWLGKSQFTGISSFKNVPQTKIMSTNGSATIGSPHWGHNNTQFDSFGSVVNAKNSTMYSAIVKIQKAAGTGTSGLGQTFTYQIGPDGRIELRPGYNSFRSLDRSVLNISNMNTSIQQRVTHVRVYFNDSKSFCDYPKVVGTENIRWKIMDMPDVGTKAEAEYLAKQEYLKAKKAPVSLNAKVVRGTQSDDVMLDGARYGYIADPQRTVYGKYPHYMMGRMNNNFFSGSVSALDGQLNNTNTPLIGASNRDASVVNASDEITWAGNNYWYGANSLANAIEVVYVPQGLPKYSMTTGNQLRFIISVDGTRSGAPTPGTIDEAATSAKFIITVIDPIFRDNATRNTGFVSSNGTDSNGDPNLIGEAEWFGACGRGDLNHIAAVNAAGQGHSHANDFFSQTVSYGSLDNGFLELNLPPTYAFGTGIVNKIIVSVNREYLESLIRMRCGDTLGNILNPAHGVPVESAPTNYFTLLGSGSYNDKSIFPLGCRYYDEFGSGMRDRTLWYAPRLIINDDINFRTGTALQYSDSTYGFTNKPLIINNVQWKINPLRHEEVVLGLTTDESHFLSNLGSMFLTPPIINDPKPSPAGPGGTSGRGDSDEDDGEPVPPGGDTTGPAPKPRPRPELTPPGTFGSQTGYTTASTIGINQVSKGIMGRLKKKMQVPMGNSEWGLLGQDRPLPAAIETSVLVSNDGVFTPSGGSAALSETGISLPGRTFAAGDSEQAEVSEVSGIQVVPNNVTNNSVTILSKVDTTVHSESAQTNQSTIPTPSGIGLNTNPTAEGFAKIYTTVKVVETGFSKTETLVIPINQNGLRHNLFNQKIEGADVAGNHLEITIRRAAGINGDTAAQESVKLSSISVTMKTGANMVDGPGEVFDTNVVSR